MNEEDNVTFQWEHNKTSILHCENKVTGEMLERESNDCKVTLKYN